MGACCDLFTKDEIFTNQSRLKALQSKVQTQLHTQNDFQFTYYLHYFEQHNYLEKVLQEYRQACQTTQDTNSFQFNINQLSTELKKLSQYLSDYDNSQSTLYKKIKTDIKLINEECKNNFSEFKDKNDFCMVKMEIQGIQTIQGITRISIIRVVKSGKDENEKRKEEFVLLNRSKNDKIYRQLVFPTIKGSKIKIKTEPIQSTITVDVQDIMKNEAVCSVLKFQHNDEDFGFIALRMQFVTNNSEFNVQRKERLAVLQKELNLCMKKKDGAMSSFSEQGSHKNNNTFISDHVSQYHNQYEA